MYYRKNIRKINKQCNSRRLILSVNIFRSVSSFEKDFQYSLDKQQTDKEILETILEDVAKVEKTDKRTDMAGADYIVKLKDGETIYVDAKRRKAGCSYFWKDKNDPELTLEILSRKEENKVGWTLNNNSKADDILYSFEPSDFKGGYYLPFKPLRRAFKKHKDEWCKKYKTFEIESEDAEHHHWHSTGVFVPASVVCEAIVSLFSYHNRTYPRRNTKPLKAHPRKKSRKISTKISKIAPL